MGHTPAEYSSRPKTDLQGMGPFFPLDTRGGRTLTAVEVVDVVLIL